jgi:hypothetical protein
MSAKFVYSVTAKMSKSDSDDYVKWLQDGHVAAVVQRGGALSGQVVLLEESEADRAAVQSIYVFASKEAYDGYNLSEVAAELRAEGKAAWVDTGKVQFSR